MPKEFDPEEIFKRVAVVRKQRTSQYKNSRVHAHNTLGSMWAGLLNCWLKQYGLSIPPIPSYIVAAMLVLMKAGRIAYNPDVQDSYDDMLNYSAITEECAVAEHAMHELYAGEGNNDNGE